MRDSSIPALRGLLCGWHSPLYLVDRRNLIIFEVSYLLRQHWSVRFQLSIYLCVASEKAILVSKPGSRGIGINITWFLNNKSRRDRDSRTRAFWDDMTLSYLLFCRAELDGGERNVFLYPCYESDKVTHAVISHSRWKTLPCTEIYSGLFGVKGRCACCTTTLWKKSSYKQKRLWAHWLVSSTLFNILNDESYGKQREREPTYLMWCEVGRWWNVRGRGRRCRSVESSAVRRKDQCTGWWRGAGTSELGGEWCKLGVVHAILDNWHGNENSASS